MSDFERLSKLLEPVANMLNTKIWICEKIGRRLSCIARSGEENYCESFKIYEDQKYVVFAEREVTDPKELEHVEHFIKDHVFSRK
ncbi:MAG: hypothetical protein ACP5KD_02995 [Fervidobacterium sp.]|jgi:hypothetical protein